MVNEFLIRIGTFFYLTGVALMFYFVLTYAHGTPDFMVFFLGLISIFIGWRLTRRKAAPPSSGRFAYLRKMREKSKKEKEEAKKE